MLVRVWWLLIAMGCGRVAFDPAGDAETTGRDGPCTPSPFSAPVRLPGPVQTASDDWFPTPTADELELYDYGFVGTASDPDIVHATRPSRTSQFSGPARVLELETTLEETTVALTQDKLYMVLTRGSTSTHLFETSRTDAAATFSAPIEITSIEVGNDDLSPWLSSDGLRMTFGSRRSGVVDIYESTRASRTDPWPLPVSLAPLNSVDHDDNPTESTDGLEIFFSSDRGGLGTYDIYRATRPSLDQPFGAPALVPELSSPMDDIGTRLSFDGLTMYFNYNSVRAGNQNADLWIATRSCD